MVRPRGVPGAVTAGWRRDPIRPEFACSGVRPNMLPARRALKGPRRRSGPRPHRPRIDSMSLRIGATAPDFEAETTQGPMRFHDWIGDSWAVLFSHPKDFTPVCTTELGYMAKLSSEWEKRNVKVIGLSVDATNDHERW